MITITLKDKEKFKFEKVAEVCAEWWAQVIRAPRFDAGSDSQAMIFSEMMATQLVQPVDDLQTSIFKENLKNAIMETLLSDRDMMLTCDYSPCAELMSVGQLANIDQHNFPWKTTMIIKPDMAKVKYGYTGTYEKIFDERIKTEEK